MLVATVQFKSFVEDFATYYLIRQGKYELIDLHDAKRQVGNVG